MSRVQPLPAAGGGERIESALRSASSPRPFVRSNLARSLDRSLACLLAAGGLLAGFTLSVLPLDGPAGALPALFPLIFLVYLGTGVLAWYRRPSNRMGLLILIAGLALLLDGLGNAGIPSLAALGTVFATLILAVIIHLLLAFPSGRLRGRASVVTVACGYATAVLLQAPQYLFGPASADPTLLLFPEPQLAQAGVVVQGVAAAAVLAATAWLLGVRLLRAGRVHRRVLTPLFSYGIAAVLFIALSGNILVRALGLPVQLVAVLQLAVVAGIPIAFIVGMLSGGFARTGQLEELGTWLGSADGQRVTLTSALASTLGDPSLDVLYWVPQRGTFVDAEGAPAAGISAGDGRAIVEISASQGTVAAIRYDAALIDDPETVRSAGRVVAIALERERLTAELRASRRALQLSRERLVDAADQERRRVARDLHDGLQMQLVLLAVEAQQLANSAATNAAASERATGLRKGIDAAAAELRRLVHEVMPAVLLERGLAAAVIEVADRMPIPTDRVIDMGDEPCPKVVEITAYFVVAESLTNAIKYAHATSCSIEVRRIGPTLRVNIDDDGVGGAAISDGSGMRSLADRVDTLGGRMRVTSEPGQGTHIEVELPCGS